MSTPDEQEIISGIIKRYENCHSYHERGTLLFSLYQKEVSDKPALDQDCLIETYFKKPAFLKSTWQSGSLAQEKTKGKLWSNENEARLYSLVDNHHVERADSPQAAQGETRGEACNEIAFQSLAEMLASDHLGKVNLPGFMPLILSRPDIVKEFFNSDWKITSIQSQAHPVLDVPCWVISEETLPTTKSYWINQEDYRIEAMLFDFRARFWESRLVNNMVGTLSQATGFLLRKPEWTLTGKSMGHRMFTQFYRITEAHFDAQFDDSKLNW